jgi:hypothetical protein
VQENMGPLPSPAQPAGQGTILPEQPQTPQQMMARNI